MVNWRETKVGFDPAPPQSWNGHAERLKRQQEAFEMAKAKRPPLKWNMDKDKPLKFVWGLFVNGKRIDDVVAYDIEKGCYVTDEYVPKLHYCSFIVKRLS